MNYGRTYHEWRDIGNILPERRIKDSFLLQLIEAIHKKKISEEERNATIIETFSLKGKRAVTLPYELYKAINFLIQREQSSIRTYWLYPSSDMIIDAYQASFLVLEGYVYDEETILSTKNKDHINPLLFPAGLDSGSHWSICDPSWSKRGVFKGNLIERTSCLTKKNIVFPTL